MLATTKNIASADSASNNKFNLFPQKLSLLVNREEIGSFRINLTKNWGTEGTSPSSLILSFQEGNTYDSLIRISADQSVTQADKESYLAAFKRETLLAGFAKGRSEVTHTSRFYLEDGKIHWVKCIVNLARHPETDTVEGIMFAFDVTERMEEKQVIQRLAHDEFDFIALIDVEDANIRFLNIKPDAEIELPYAEEKLSAYESRNLSRLLDAATLAETLEKTTLPVILQQLSRNDTYSYAFSYTSPNLPPLRKQVRYSYLDETQKKILLIQTDITEIYAQSRKHQEELEIALQAAKQASVAKSDFLSRMSHEIRTPLNAIIGMDVLAAQAIGQEEKVADCISKIGLSARYLLSLINDILDMSRIESGKMLLKNDKFLFPDFINSINTIIYNQTKAKGLDYECLVASDVETGFIGDEMKLQQILINVLGNAVKFTSRGKVSLEVHCLARKGSLSKLRFVINDTGCGISEDACQKIFEPFEQADTSTTALFGGTGLGLAITKSLIDLMGGKISVRSIVGIGSEFTIDIPLTIDDSILTAPKPHLHLEKLHTLIVDDDLFICEQTLAILKEIGMKGEWVTSGQEALAKVTDSFKQNRYFDVVLIDWKMPEMNGIETTREIRKIVGPNVTIIIISAYDWQSIEAEAKAAGANMLISKPLLKSTLISAFEKALGDTGAQKAPPVTDFNFSGKRILVVEDNALNTEIAKKLLEHKNFLVETAANGLKAMEKFIQNPAGYYDIILMDVRMPLMDGLQATSNIRHCDKSDAKTIPIIAMTANAFDEDMEKSKASGMNAHLSKPIEPDLLYLTLYKFLQDQPALEADCS